MLSQGQMKKGNVVWVFGIIVIIMIVVLTLISVGFHESNFTTYVDTSGSAYKVHDAKYFYDDCMNTAASHYYYGYGMEYWLPICVEEAHYKYDPTKQ